MPDLVVADAGPLIALARIRRLKLIRDLWKRVVVPEAVWEEAVEATPDAPGAARIREARAWIEVERAEEDRIAAIAVILDRGEAEALALTLEHEDATLLVDDLRARKLAIKMRLDYIGTLGVLLRAKKRGLLETVKIPLDELKDTGLYLSDSLVQRVLAEAGENS